MLRHEEASVDCHSRQNTFQLWIPLTASPTLSIVNFHRAGSRDFGGISDLFFGRPLTKARHYSVPCFSTRQWSSSFQATATLTSKSRLVCLFGLCVTLCRMRSILCPDVCSLARAISVRLRRAAQPRRQFHALINRLAAPSHGHMAFARGVSMIANRFRHYL
ncbi:hypothetical protein EJ04DRAFT_52656 [Polyplosphaeria fusca]|uniref:Uncharacterized protein n=1 Tax=Polyplosphaeria fusca TaxID=682080 RepID=A0A9P4R8L1_9PLEO|nr:hypothetical protein EJ04DRAFT_52656 [Polyplosphaeria fusca]